MMSKHSGYEALQLTPEASVAVLSAMDKTPMRRNKRDRILLRLVEGGWHRLKDLEKIGGTSADRRIRELRGMGVPIESSFDPKRRYMRARVPRYRIEPIGKEK